MANHKNRERNYRLYLLNVKLRHGASEDRYSDLFHYAFNLRLPICVRGEECLVMKSLNVVNCSITPDRSTSVLAGKFVRYTRIDGKDWFDLNTMDKAEDVDIPSNVFPNLKETDYFFFPEAHRLAFVLSRGFSPAIVLKYLRLLLEQSKNPEEELEITLITDVEQVDRILQAVEIRRLVVSLSYSNADEHEAAEEVIENLMKGTKASTFKNEMTGSIDPDSDLVKAYLHLASNNGYAEAKVKEDGETRFKTIKTTNYPKLLSIKSEDSSLLQKVTLFIINTWRNVVK